MNAIKVKELAALVLKAYSHFGVSDSRINRRWLVEYDLYGAERAVARSFNVLNGESYVTMEQICQRGREIACEDQGALYQSWCAIKEIMENDWLYEPQPFAPAESILRTVIFEEYLMVRNAHAKVPRQQAAQEFKTLERSLDRERTKLEPMDIYLMMDEAKDAFDGDEAILGALAVIMKNHFANPSCQPTTVDASVTEEAHEDDIVVSEPEVQDNIEEIIDDAEYEEQSLFEEEEKKVYRGGRGNLLDCNEELKKIYGDEVELVGDYHGMHYNMTLRCKTCGKEWTRRGDKVFFQPYGCSRCAARKAVENPGLDVGSGKHSPEYRSEYIRAYLDKHSKGEYTCYETGIVGKNVVEVRHEKCGTNFILHAGEFKKALKDKKGFCPACRKDAVEYKDNEMTKGETNVSESKDVAAIGLFELQKYYNKAYTQIVGGQLETGWKSMTNSMRAVMPDQYAYEKVSKKGKHVNLLVTLEDIEWITYYYADLAKTPTTDNNALSRAIRNSKVWAEILKTVKPLLTPSAVEEKSAEQAGNEASDHIVTIEEQEEAKRMQKLQELQQKNLRKGLETALKNAGNTHFANTIDAVIKMISVAKSMRALPDEVVAFIASAIGVKIGEVSTKEFEALKNELEQAKVANADLRGTVEELQKQLDEANEWKESVRGLLASA